MELAEIDRMKNSGRKKVSPVEQFDTEGIVEKDDRRTTEVKMTVTLPRSVAAFLRWKAEVEGLRRDELLRRIITHYARQLRAKDLQTPEVWD